MTHERVYLWFADNGDIRKWQPAPLREGTEYVREDLLAAAQSKARMWRRVAERLESEKQAAQAEARKWKAAHDEMVRRNRLLRERSDLPPERTKLYVEYMQLQAENKRLRAQQAPLNGTINKLRRENKRLAGHLRVIATTNQGLGVARRYAEKALAEGDGHE